MNELHCKAKPCTACHLGTKSYASQPDDSMNAHVVTLSCHIVNSLHSSLARTILIQPLFHAAAAAAAAAASVCFAIDAPAAIAASAAVCKSCYEDNCMEMALQHWLGSLPGGNGPTRPSTTRSELYAAAFISGESCGPANCA